MPDNTEPVLSQRLYIVALMIKKNSTVIDVGTDHAFLPVWLINNNYASIVYAADVNEGPVAKAYETITILCNDKNRVVLKKCDGLSGFSPDDADTIVIAGMGGETIIKILKGAAWTKDGNHTIILQPMTKVTELRKFLFNSGYVIKDETAVKEGKKVYIIIKAVGGIVKDYDKIFEFITPFAMKNEAGFFYLDKLIKRQYKIIDGLKKSKNADVNKVYEASGILFRLIGFREEYKCLK